MYGRILTMRYTQDYSDKIKKLKAALKEADCVLIEGDIGEVLQDLKGEMK